MIEPLLSVILLSKICSTQSVLVPILPNKAPRTFNGRIHYTETRVNMSKPMFILAASILTFNLITFIIFSIYVRRNRLPWVPKSIAATLAYVAWSDQAMVDMQRTSQMSTKTRERFLEARDGKYRLGFKDSGEGKGQVVVDRAESVRAFLAKNKAKRKWTWRWW